MRVTTDQKPEQQMLEIKQRSTPARLWKRVMWLVVIWSASILALGAVSMMFRLMMTAAGMKSH
jgi:hypothetical protein